MYLAIVSGAVALANLFNASLSKSIVAAKAPVVFLLAVAAFVNLVIVSEEESKASWFATAIFLSLPKASIAPSVLPATSIDSIPSVDFNLFSYSFHSEEPFTVAFCNA